jgi:hypothetical protein
LQSNEQEFIDQKQVGVIKIETLPECKYRIRPINRGHGWFSLLGGALCGFHKYGPLTYIDWKQTLYADRDNNNTNTWDYVFEPNSCKVTKRTKTKRLAGFKCGNGNVELKEWNKVLHENVRIKESVRQRADEFVKNHFGNHTLGVHIRASDRAKDRDNLALHNHAVPTKRITDAIDKYLKKNPSCDKIFVASDNVAQLKEIEQKYGHLIVYQKNITRSNNTEPIHNFHDGYNKAIEVTVDMLIMAKTEYLIKSMSQVSLTSIIYSGGKGFDLLNIPDGYKYETWRTKVLGLKKPLKNKYVE